MALFADDADVYETIVREVTAERVREHFGAMVTGDVTRYEAPNVLALNFVLRGALGGGGPRSLRSDTLGKTLGGALVRLEIEVPDALADRRAAPSRRDVGARDRGRAARRYDCARRIAFFVIATTAFLICLGESSPEKT